MKYKKIVACVSVLSVQEAHTMSGLKKLMNTKNRYTVIGCPKDNGLNER